MSKPRGKKKGRSLECWLLSENDSISYEATEGADKIIWNLTAINGHLAQEISQVDAEADGSGWLSGKTLEAATYSVEVIGAESTLIESPTAEQILDFHPKVMQFIVLSLRKMTTLQADELGFIKPSVDGGSRGATKS